jgi:hypothetical protein
MSTINTTSNWLRFGAFLSPPVPCLRIHWPLTIVYWPLFTCHWPQFSRHSPLATRHSPLATRHSPLATRHSPLATRHYLLRPFPAGYCLTPTADLAKTERGPISTSTPFLSVWHQTGRSLRKNPSVFPRSPPLDRRPFSRGRRRSTPVAPRNSQTPVRRPSQMTGVRPENGCSNSKAAAPDLAEGKTREVAV